MERPTELTCEYQTDPIAIDKRAPRLAWVNRSSRTGDRQSAYRITVYHEGDVVWGSGRVRSHEHHQIPYAGEPLVESARYEWTVVVWDGDGNESPPSYPGRFETAIMSPDGWKASWITMENPTAFETLTRVVVGDIKSHAEHFDGHYHAIYLHKTFTLAAEATLARIHICGLGYYQLFINGRRVGDRHLDPAQTDYKHSALYSTFDVGGYITRGENAIGIVLGNGRHIKPFGYGTPMAIAQLRASLAGGSEVTLYTDSTWWAMHGPIRENGIYLGEVRDQREAIPGWATTGFSNETGSATKAVAVDSGPTLRSQGLPPVRTVKELRASSIHSPDPGVHIFDYGENMSGIIRLVVNGPRGQKVRVRFSELVDADGRLHLGTNREAVASDTYIVAGDGNEVYEPSFTYHGFRYAELTGFPGVPTERNLVALVTHTDVQPAGAFRCSLPLFNKIHEAVLRGQLSNLNSVPTDCPQRGERMGWLGDAQLTGEQAIHNYSMPGFYTKYLEDIRDSQLADGSLSDVTPPYWPLYPADPAWATAYATLAWNMYFYYGDREILERHYQGIKRYVEFLDRTAENGILRIGKYGDWCPPGCTYPKRTPMALTSTWYYYHDTAIVARIAEVLGEDADCQLYAERAESIKAAFNREFNDRGKYAVNLMSPIDNHGGQTSQLLPLALDMVPGEDREQSIEVLLGEVVKRFDYHPDTGIIGTRYLLEVLSAIERPDAAYRILAQTSYPSIGHMIEQGATTLWERWENLSGVGMNSHNHIMFGSVDTWFYKTVCGISATEPAFARVRIAPWLPPGMTHAEATLETVHGTLSSSWSRSEGTGRLVVRIPVGCTGEVVIPDGEVGAVESGEHSFQWAI